MSTRVLLNIVIFQAGWFASIVWLNTGALAALVIGASLHYLLISRSVPEWLVIAAGAMLGVSMDMAWQRLGLVHYSETLAGGFPFWLCVIWVLFMTTLAHSLQWLQHNLVLASVAGALAAPFSYWAGVKLGAAEPIIETWQLMLVIGSGWACLLPLLVFIMRSALNPGEQVS